MNKEIRDDIATILKETKGSRYAQELIETVDINKKVVLKKLIDELQNPKKKK
jgi:hypothetical protein